MVSRRGRVSACRTSIPCADDARVSASFLKRLPRSASFVDLAVMGEALPDAGLFTDRYDRMYCTSNLCVNRVYDTIVDRSFPNNDEPSDHLPVAATFGLK